MSDKINVVKDSLYRVMNDNKKSTIRIDKTVIKANKGYERLFGSRDSYYVIYITYDTGAAALYYNSEYQRDQDLQYITDILEVIPR